MKKILLTIVLVFTAFASHAQTSLRGDVDGDGNVSITDVMMIVNHILGAEENGFIVSNADFNSDGEIDISDVMKVVEIILNGQGEADQCLVVWHKDGSKVMFQLAECPKVTYLGENVIIQGSSTVEYEFQAIRKMTFDMVARSAFAMAMPFVNYGETVTFQPANNDLNVKVSSEDGKVLKELVVRKGETASLPLDVHTADTYKINVNGVIYKIKTR